MKFKVTKEKMVINSKKGFTLLELLAVLVILSALTVIVIPLFKNKGLESRIIVHNENIKILKEQANMYMLEHDIGSGIDITDKLVESGLIKEIPYNPLPKEMSESKSYRVKIDENGIIKINVKMVDIINIGDEEHIDYNVAMGVNKPKLVKGMSAVKFDGVGLWIDILGTPEDNNDNEWYKYNGDIESTPLGGTEYTTDRWANVKLDDGSLYVWIPRYTYKIYEDGINSKIEIKYSKGIQDYNENGFLSHPAFKFGNDELTGIWVAKFEASNNSGEVASVPGVTSWRSISVNNIFNECLEIKEERSLGLTVDTHMMKNSEWGAVAYLTEAIRDRNQMWINNDSGYITGSCGNSESAISNKGTVKDYKSDQCQKASTTGNVYGIYDMSGGAWEFVASYVGLGNNNGKNLSDANKKYREKLVDEIYSDKQQNYESAEGKTKGWAVHEISTRGDNDNNPFQGYNDYQFFPYTTYPYFVRGGGFYDAASAGIFAINFNNSIDNGQFVSFRPTMCIVN